MIKIKILIFLLFSFNISAMEDHSDCSTDSLHDRRIAKSSHAYRYKLNAEICNHCNTRVANMEEHLQTNILPESLKCGLCHLSFQNYYFLAVHQIDFWDKHFSCATCTKIFTHQADFESHACEYVPVKKEEKLEKPKDYFCICGHGCQTPSGIYKHKKNCKKYQAFLMGQS